MRSAALLLCPEDFAEPRPSPRAQAAPETPGFTREDVEEARRAGRQEGERAARLTAEAADRARIAALLARIAERLDGAAETAAATAELQAAALVRLLLDALGTAFPTLRERCGEAEMRRLIAAVVPSLAGDGSVTLHIAPAQCEAAETQLAALRLRRAAPPQVIGDAAVAPGDVDIRWEGGRAVRDAAALWCDVLSALGLPPAETCTE